MYILTILRLQNVMDVPLVDILNETSQIYTY